MSKIAIILPLCLCFLLALASCGDIAKSGDLVDDHSSQCPDYLSYDSTLRACVFNSLLWEGAYGVPENTGRCKDNIAFVVNRDSNDNFLWKPVFDCSALNATCMLDSEGVAACTLGSCEGSDRLCNDGDVYVCENGVYQFKRRCKRNGGTCRLGVCEFPICDTAGGWCDGNQLSICAPDTTAGDEQLRLFVTDCMAYEKKYAHVPGKCVVDGEGVPQCVPICGTLNGLEIRSDRGVCVSNNHYTCDVFAGYAAVIKNFCNICDDEGHDCSLK